jgi:hypothetical protein
VRRLEALPEWLWDPREALWEEGYVRLQGFAQRERHSRVPFAYRDADGYRLGSWVNTQRRAWTRRTLAKARARRLETLPGWAWAARGSSKGRNSRMRRR